MAFFVGSTTNLAGNGTWTSNTKWRDRHDTVWGTVYASHAGTVHIEQSMDGDFTVVDFDTSVSVSATTGTTFSANLVAPFWRVRYANGGTQQTTFRIQATTQAGGDS